MNTFGNIFRFTDFGESHGAAVGGVIDGCPAGLAIDFDAIQHDLNRRAGRAAVPQDSVVFESSTTEAFSTSDRARTEEDKVEWLSGILNGVTLGTPIAFLIRNTNANSADYDHLKEVIRPAHADFTYWQKYGIRDHRGGGRASARETAARVVAGSIAKQLLSKRGIAVAARVTQVGNETEEERINALLKEVREAGDSIGGIVECRVSGMPVGIGEPVADKLQARLAYAVMSIQACKGFDYGSGFAGVGKRGSLLNSFSGGALGGISDGTDFCFRCVFKPAPSISLPQQTFTTEGVPAEISVHGRHDICVALRAPVIVEAMTAMTILDLLLTTTPNPRK